LRAFLRFDPALPTTDYRRAALLFAQGLGRGPVQTDPRALSRAAIFHPFGMDRLPAAAAPALVKAASGAHML